MVSRYGMDLSCKRGVRIIHRCGLYTGKDGNAIIYDI